MKRQILNSYLGPALLVCFAYFGHTQVSSAETFDSTIADTRTVLAFAVDASAAQSWLPEGWTVVSAPSGPFAGANVNLVFIDRLLHLGADNEPKGGGAYRMAVVVIPAKNDVSDTSTLFVARVYTPHEGAGPYKTSVNSAVSRNVELSGTNVGPNSGADNWQVDHEGQSLSLQMQYEPSVPKLIERESQLRSTAEPDFYRIYRYQQLLDVVHSRPAGIERVPNLEIDVNIEELDSMFDGSEELVGIAVIPWYTRETFLP